jgi:hypothetical protein
MSCVDQPRALERYHLFVMRDDVLIVVATSVVRSQVRSIVRAFPLDFWHLRCENGEVVEGNKTTILRRLSNGPAN